MCVFCGFDVSGWLVDAACGSPAIRRRRAAIVPRACGDVLEIGAGGGRNFPHYDRERVRSVLAIDPSPSMLARARRRSPGDLRIDFREATAQTATADVGSFDTILTTFTLCTIPDPAAALAALRPALRPDGRLLFCEHGLAPDESVRRRQRGIEPLWRRLASGCHLTRDIPAIIEAAGWRILRLEARYIRGAPRFAGYISWGEAEPAS
jgi:SAM-dependent methyltransferase